MTHTFVLMHGAWHGGWCWNTVATHLCAAGHEVYQPTAPGLSRVIECAGSHESMFTTPDRVGADLLRASE